MLLKGKKALVTGGGQGIGRAIAEAFIHQGSDVAIVGRNLEKLKKVHTELGPKIFPFVADISQIKDLDHMYRLCHDKIGNLDILVANAGVSQETPLESASEADFDFIMSTNLKGVFFTIQRALPYLNEGCSIILISSLAGKQGINRFSIYAASKAAVDSLAKSFAAELAPKNIRVNTISPGVVRTPILNAPGLSELSKSWTNTIPMKRFCQPNEIASVALFLASNQSSYMTAADIAVDGGVSGVSPF